MPSIPEWQALPGVTKACALAGTLSAAYLVQHPGEYNRSRAWSKDQEYRSRVTVKVRGIVRVRVRRSGM